MFEYSGSVLKEDFWLEVGRSFNRPGATSVWVIFLQGRALYIYIISSKLF